MTVNPFRAARPRTPRTLRRRGRALTTILATAVVLGSTLVSASSAASAKGISYAVKSVPAPSAAELVMMHALLLEINLERRLHHLPAVRSNKYLALSARRHDVAMSRANTMSHQLPGEAFFATRMTAAGYKWAWAGENIAWNSRMTTAGVIQLEKMMYNERPPNDGHRVNILSSHFRDVGVDVYLDAKHHKVWLTTDFGSH